MYRIAETGHTVSITKEKFLNRANLSHIKNT